VIYLEKTKQEWKQKAQNFKAEIKQKNLEGQI
jgi:hypothetical protein